MNISLFKNIFKWTNSVGFKEDYIEKDILKKNYQKSLHVNIFKSINE